MGRPAKGFSMDAGFDGSEAEGARRMKTTSGASVVIGVLVHNLLPWKECLYLSDMSLRTRNSGGMSGSCREGWRPGPGCQRAILGSRLP